MKYHGNNPVGLAIATDATGEARDRLLRSLDQYQAVVQHQLAASSTPATYERLLAAAQCAADCAQVVKEFHAVCSSADREQAGLGDRHTGS